MTDVDEPTRAETRHIAELNRRSLERVETTIATVERVIAANRLLASRPSHTDSAERRIHEGEQELAALHAEYAALEQGNLDAALKIAEEARLLRSRDSNGRCHTADRPRRRPDT
jgi:hypothetical protein